MKCPKCGVWTIIKETRERLDGTKRRTYECGNEHRFNTVERPEWVAHGGDRKSTEFRENSEVWRRGERRRKHALAAAGASGG